MTARFTGPLDIREIGYEVWQVLTPFDFISDHGCTIAIPEGFVTDLASVPALARGFVSKIGYWSQPAVVHDALYQWHSGNITYKLPSNVDAGYNPTDLDLFKKSKPGLVVDRVLADSLLLEGCKLKAKQYDIRPYQDRSKIIYTAVRFGGADGWYSEQELKKRRQEIIDAGEDYLD